MINHPEGKPCWAPGAADYLESLLTGREVAIEWGGGASSVWLMLKPMVSFLTVIEHDEDWAAWIEKRIDPTRSKVILTDKLHEDYVKAGEEGQLIGGPRPPHVYLIDGYQRIDCLSMVDRLKKSGDIIVADDALDYCEHVLDDGDFHWGKLKRFAAPHPHAGIPINHAKYGHRRNTVRKAHADTRETWVWRV